MAGVTLKITGMHCSHCRTKVEQALQRVAGVYGAAVDLEQGAAEVDFDAQKTAPAALMAAVELAGYHAELSAGTGDRGPGTGW